MERLTYWNEEYGCWSYRCPSGDAANRLAAYENTGLEPEDADQIRKAAEYMMFETVGDFVRLAISNFDELQSYRALGTIEELSALVKARDEGLLLMLPCKPGTEIFGHCDIRGANPISRGYFYPPYIPKLGVDAWLTRAEAEAALGGGGDGS